MTKTKKQLAVNTEKIRSLSNGELTLLTGVVGGTKGGCTTNSAHKTVQ